MQILGGSGLVEAENRVASHDRLLESKRAVNLFRKILQILLSLRALP